MPYHDIADYNKSSPLFVTRGAFHIFMGNALGRAIVVLRPLVTIISFSSVYITYAKKAVEASAAEKPWRYEAKEEEEEEEEYKIFDHEISHGATKETPTHYLSTPTQSHTVATTIPSLPDRVVVMAKLPTDDTRWVHTDLPDWQSAIYDIDTETPHKISNLDPLTNSTLRALRNKDGYPVTWHTDNSEPSNVVSLQTLNINFIQGNGYANLRCIPDPGCPHEVMPFRDRPEEHRTIEAAMPDAWRDLFNNTDVPHILATPCCAQFAVSSKQVRKRPLDEYKKYYTWLMETPLKGETSGWVFEYLWHILFGQEPVYCPAYEKCYCDVYNKC
ncbi:hypothetical protein COCMIDRAFT_40424 [Bipolaris oryzae ATCC 44560]|uniref:Uncharacterized protein n=1 Tax=Bipolaris oryzae ATCC 44560 TaxID=930090 RepID=W6Z144_COCMI|nr:uncharacterized protein COCMIDRAFT_40424 [Bipolaris oryzae ATCC 44560]EUC41384.1 hypothetical protein COCMIDRAFT_40424 [Bipolaris oryzae ATCC 44560]